MKKLILLMACAVLATASAHAQRMYDSGGRQIGRAEGLRRRQIILFFYFYM